MEIHLNELGQHVGEPIEWSPVQPPNRATMVGTYCRLEPVDIETHSASLFDAYSASEDGRMWTYMYSGPFNNVTELRDWMAETCLGNDTMFFAIVDITSGKALGMASFMRIKPDTGVVEVGNISFSPALQKTSAATEAMYLMMKHIFDLGYRRYEWKCNALNEGSMLAAERLGFRYEGVFRQLAVAKGRNRDTAWFSILDSEWPKLREGLEAWLKPENFEDGQQIESLATKMGFPHA